MAQILYSTFNVSNNGNDYNGSTFPYGACVQNCANFEIEEDTFQVGFIGLAMIETGNGLKVYRNIFQNLYVGSLGNGNNNVLLNGNAYYNNSNPTYYPAGIPNFTWGGGDMMVFNGNINLNQTMWNNSFLSTYNYVYNGYCTPYYNRL